MDPSGSAQFDISDFYRRFCEIKYANGRFRISSVHSQESECERAKCCRDALSLLLKTAESRLPVQNIFNELMKLMSQLNLTVEFSEFSRFYDFVFFICRENGQKNITVSRAVVAWRLVLAGRFRLLNQWCDFVERNQRFNISEDTWHQVLAFSRCVRETLEDYDPKGAWPVLIDEFVDYMYRISGSRNDSYLHYTCLDFVSNDDSLPGLTSLPGLKRRLTDVPNLEEYETSDACHPDSMDPEPFMNSKRQRLRSHLPLGPHDDCTETVRQTNSPISPSKGPCLVDHRLSKRFAGLLSLTIPI